jgi:hypothetical protein
MSHEPKTFLKIIHKKIYDKYEEKSDDIQYDFKNNPDTREALYATTRIKRPMQECIYMLTCFIYYQKAFDI